MKSIVKTMTNGEIYDIAVQFMKLFENNDTYMPAAVAFGIQKNKATLRTVAEDIENGRLEIIRHYGTIKEDGSFTVAEELVEVANKELADLLAIEQEVKLYLCKIEELGDTKFTSAQMEAFMIMIEEE